jgi:hypothetical protein
LKDQRVSLSLTQKTVVEIAKGKIVDQGALSDVKEDEQVSVWLTGDGAEKVMVFRAGSGAFPGK